MNSKDEISQISDEGIVEISNIIHTVRGVPVILDNDLASLYGVETKRLNESVKRNSARFPDNFCFQLSQEEFSSLRSQNSTSSEIVNSYGGRRYLPYAFTEQGIAMLSAVLKSDTAIKVSIGIMEAFVRMRKYLSENSLMLERIKTIEVEQLEFKKESEEKFNKIFTYISDHEEDNQKIFFDGQVYDALSFLTNLVKKAKKSIVLIDNYVDMMTLDILSKKNAEAIVDVFTLPNTKINKNDLSKFNLQYRGLTLHTTNKFHDRFLIVDDTIAYHIGASLKDAGKKCFGINLIEDEELISVILRKLTD